MSDASSNNGDLSADFSAQGSNQGSDQNVKLREKLVAYLDGELSGDASLAIEKQIASDEIAQEELRGLDQAWNALDVLPLEQTDHDFTQSTVEMVTLVASEEVLQATTAMPKIQRRRQWGTTLALGALLVAGFLLTAIVSTYRERQLLHNLPDVLHAQTLAQVGSLEFLRDWSSSSSRHIRSLLTDDLTDEAATWGVLTAEQIVDRYQWVADLPPEDAVDLASKSRLFNAMTEVKREKVRSLNHELNEAPDAASLREYALVYQQLVSKLPSIEQALLRDMPTEQRIERMEQELRQLRDKVLYELTDEQQRVFRAAIIRVAEELRPFPFEKQQDEELQLLRKRQRNPLLTEAHLKQVRLLLLAHFAGRGGEHRGGRGGRDIPPERRRLMQNALLAYWKPIQADLVEALPDSIQQQIADKKSLTKQAKIVSNLLAETLQNAKIDDPSVYFAEELDKKEQLELLALPVDEMNARLQDLMSSEVFELQMWQGGPGGPGSFMGPPDGARGGGRRRGGGPGGAGDHPGNGSERGGRPGRKDGPRGDGPPGRRPPPEFAPPGPLLSR